VIAHGVRVRAWTVDDLVDLDVCLRADVDEVTTNTPAETLAALRAAGWTEPAARTSSGW